MRDKSLKASRWAAALAGLVGACGGSNNPAVVGDLGAFPDDVAARDGAGLDAVTVDDAGDGGSDAGRDDAGPVDTGADAASLDAAADVAPDLGPCAEGEIRCAMACVRLASDVAHCGACDTVCAGASNAAATCAGGVCGLRCAAGFADCDNNPGNGCEVALDTTASHCGACGTVCAGGANATPRCAAAQCSLACGPSFGDCDGRADNGCEVDLSRAVAHCGACGAACAAGANSAAACEAGRCLLQCNMHFADCDQMASTGCEVDTRASASHCGGCGRACVGGQVCSSGVCVTPRILGYAFMPGPGSVHFHAPRETVLSVTFLPDGSAASTQSLTVPAQGVADLAFTRPGTVQVEATGPFVAWLHDNGNTDQLEAATTLEGAPQGQQLLTWARSAVTVVTGPMAPTRVVVQRVMAAGVNETLATFDDLGPGQHRIVSVGGAAGVYRVLSEGAAVTAFGQSLVETYNHAGYVPAESGGFVGTTFRYAEPTGASGQRRLVVQSLDGAGRVTFTQNGNDSPAAMAGALPLASSLVAPDTLMRAVATVPSIAWLEADPAQGCDGTLSDSDFVPSVEGALLGTEWRFSTHVAPHTCLASRRSDIDVLAYEDGTGVVVYEVGSTTPLGTRTLARGERFRVLTDAAPSRPLRVVSSRPAMVQHSHADFDFLMRMASVTLAQ
ncbi:MAG: hypothetical protein JNK72_22385 [Myxococcales bacterium]|nr:hypothetical protein [Myxococcales bacterium]